MSLNEAILRTIKTKNKLQLYRFFLLSNCFNFSFFNCLLAALANAHVKQVFREASCRLPQPRIVRIQMDPAKTYMPHCTVLHRCADDTGCCLSEGQTCTAKRTKSVDLFFFVSTLERIKPDRYKSIKIVKLNFRIKLLGGTKGELWMSKSANV